MEKLKEIYNDLVEEYNALLEEYEQIKLQLEKEKENIKTIHNRLQMQITLAIIENKMEVLERAMDNIEVKQELPSYIEASSEGIAVPNSINNALKNKLEKEYKELAVLSMKRILVNEFREQRHMPLAKTYKWFSAVLGIYGGLAVCAVISFFYLLIFETIIDNSLMLFCSSAIIGSIVGKKSFDKYNSKMFSIFNEINGQLEEADALELTSDNSNLELNQIIEQIERKINKLVITEMTQREYQANLDAYTESQQSQNTLMQALNVEPVMNLEEPKEETKEVAGPRLVITKPVKPITLNED